MVATLEHSVALTTDTRVLPQQVAVGALLEMSPEDLERHIHEEVQKNPALEWRRRIEAGRQQAKPQHHFLPSSDHDRLHDWSEEFDPLSVVPASFGLADHLQWQLHAEVDADERPRCLLIVESLDADGYLRTPLYELAQRACVSLAAMEQALHTVQAFDPPGIAARSLKECLLLQLDALEGGVEPPPQTREVISLCDEVPTGSMARQIARRLRLSPARVDAVWRFVRENLRPYPGESVRPWWGKGAPRPPGGYIRPDVLIQLEEGRITVEVPQSYELELRVNAIYRRLEGDLQIGPGRRLGPEGRHIRECVQRAREFINNVRRRNETLQVVTEAIAQEQRQFLTDGVVGLKPLTKKAIAQRTGFHESTISRATRNKFVQLPTEETIPFDLFFDDALPVKVLLKQIVSNEDQRRPLSDNQLARELAKRGVFIARRTVTKYRAEMGVPPVELRGLAW